MNNSATKVMKVGNVFTKSKMQLSLFTLVDVNECSDSSHSCDADADCSNTAGSYTCRCRAGFYGNGFDCTGRTVIWSTGDRKLCFNTQTLSWTL